MYRFPEIILAACFVGVFAFMGCRGRGYTSVPTTAPISNAIAQVRTANTAVEREIPRAPAESKPVLTKAVSDIGTATNTIASESERMYRANTGLLLQSQEADRKLVEAKRTHAEREAKLEAEIYEWEHDRWLGGLAIIWRNRIVAAVFTFWLVCGCAGAASIIYGGPLGLSIGKRLLGLLPFANPFSWAANKWGK